MSSEVTRRDEWQTAVWVNALVHTCFTHSETEKNGLTWAESKSSTLTFTASRVCVCVWEAAVIFFCQITVRGEWLFRQLHGTTHRLTHTHTYTHWHG